MLLANAIYFKSDWLKPFDRSQTFAEPFFATVDGSRPVSAIMMHAKGSYQGAVLDDLDAKSLFMPYQVAVVHFFILPRRVVTFRPGFY